MAVQEEAAVGSCIREIQEEERRVRMTRRNPEPKQKEQ